MKSGASKARLGLLLLVAGIIPPLIGLRIPGGLVAEQVDFDEKSIVFLVWPWALSIAVVTWLYLRESEWIFSTWLILAGGAAAGLLLSTPLRKAAEDAGVLTSEGIDLWRTIGLSDSAVNGDPLLHTLVSTTTRLAEVHPIVEGFVWATVIGVSVVLLYALLYGWPLWLAGLICGALLGRKLYAAFPGQAAAADAAGEPSTAAGSGGGAPPSSPREPPNG